MAEIARKAVQKRIASAFLLIGSTIMGKLLFSPAVWDNPGGFPLQSMLFCFRQEKAKYYLPHYVACAYISHAADPDHSKHKWSIVTYG